MTTRLQRQALEKLSQQQTHTVVRGDTLSALAKRYGTTVANLQRHNNLEHPDRLSIGQSLRIPGQNGSSVESAIPQTTSHQTGINAVARELRKQFNNPNLEAAILANIDRETGGTFDHRTWQGNKRQVFDPSRRQRGGYGLFQMTGPGQTDYKKWLLKNKFNDSMPNQIGFMKSVYGPSRTGWKKNVQPNAGLTREQLADWWHKRVETPAHVLKGTRYYSPERIESATQRHNDFMRRKIRPGISGWTQT